MTMIQALSWGLDGNLKSAQSMLMLVNFPCPVLFYFKMMPHTLMSVWMKMVGESGILVWKCGTGDE